jgi:hypothetical protein
MVPTRLSRRHSTTRAAISALLVTALLGTGCTPAATVHDEPHEVTGVLHGRTGAGLVVADAASRVEVRLAEIPGLLYRISTPIGSGVVPLVTGGVGVVRLGLRPTEGKGPKTVSILLSRRVRWDIRLPAGAGEQRLDLTGGKVTRLDLGSSGLTVVALPRPVGTVRVRLIGGIGDVTFTGRGPIRFSLWKGADAIRTPWFTAAGVPQNTVLRQPGWTATPDRYAVYARTEVGRLSVFRNYGVGRST